MTKKDITALFVDENLAANDFIRYEHFPTLGHLVSYNEELLIDKLREVISRDMQIALVGKGGSNVPKKWTKFVNMLLDFYRELNLDMTQGTVLVRAAQTTAVIP